MSEHDPDHLAGAADEPAGDPAAQALPPIERQRRPARRPPRFSAQRMRAEWPLIVVLVGVVVSLLLMIFDRWRRGAFAIGVVALLACLLRAVLPETRIGLLAVRSRWFDLGFYALCGIGIIWLSLSVDSLGTG